MFARIRIIETPTRKFETPILFPVHNAGARGKGNSPEYWREIPDLNTMMLNAYLIKENPIYEKFVEVGLHRYFKTNGIFFVDSGGLQKRIYDLEFEQAEILKVQELVGADIASTLDIPLLRNDNLSDIDHQNYLKKTIKNAIFCLKRREREDMLLYASIHGNNTKTLINVIDYLNKRGDFDGFAIGGLVPKRSDFRHIIDLILAVRRRVENKPLHIFGLGGPSYIPLMVYLGADSFDSSSFLMAGSKRVYFVPDEGSIDFQEMAKTTRLPCVCPVCSKRTFDEVRNQRKLIALHNLWMISYEIRKLKISIAEGVLEEYLEKRFNSNPIMQTAFRYAKVKMRCLA